VIPAIEGAKAAVVTCAAVAVFAFGIYIGQRWNAGEVADAKAAVERANLVSDRWKDAAEGFEGAVGLFRQRDIANLKELDRLTREAGELSRKLADEQARADRDYAEWQARFDAASRSPDCQELLKETTCAAFRSY
jgi:hypothetical protein